MLKGKTAVITGGVRGIGKAIAKAFCRNGANVILCYRSNDAEAEKTAAELSGGRSGDGEEGRRSDKR